MHGEPVGSGQETFRYRAPYIFRVAISTNRILQLEEGTGTLQYKDSATAQTRYRMVRAEECMRRFLHHILPDRCVKVRSDGLLSPGHRHLLPQARERLGAETIARNPAGKVPKVRNHSAVKEPVAVPRCPTCGSPLILVQTLRPKGRWPPCPCLHSRYVALHWGRRHLSCAAARAGGVLLVHKCLWQRRGRMFRRPTHGALSHAAAS